MSKSRKSYVPYQSIWYSLIELYNHTFDNGARVLIVDDLIDNLVDMDKGKKALYSIYKKWEKDVWIPLCQKRFKGWIDSNPLISDSYERQRNEWNSIKEEENSKRFHKIQQIIQDSGIGLGDFGSRGGYYAGPKDPDKYT